MWYYSLADGSSVPQGVLQSPEKKYTLMIA